MIESVDKRRERDDGYSNTASFAEKKAEQRFHLNGRSDFRRRRKRSEGEKKRTFFSLSTVLGPESPEAMRQKKSDLKRYFTIVVVVVVWYSTFFTKVYLIDTALHIGRTYYYTTRQTFDCS